MRPKAFLIKVNREESYFEIVETPRFMTEHERERFERRRKALFSDWVFAIGEDEVDVGERLLESPF
jgi:hypothetical protein